MAFEFFFGLLGLISGDSKSRHKSRLESEWRLPTPLDASLFRSSGLKGPLTGSGAAKSGAAQSSPVNSASQKQRPIFSTTGTLAAANINEGLLGANSSSSASSVASSGSNLTVNSTSAFIKPAEHTKKYEFSLNLIGEKAAGGLSSAPSFPDDGLISALKSGAASPAVADLGLDGARNDSLGQDADDDDDDEPASSSAANAARATGHRLRLRKLYCLVVCSLLWLHVARLIVGLLVDKSLFTLDFYSLGAYKIHFLIPAMCLAIQAAAVSTLFIRNNNETNWLVPFYSSKDYLIRSRSNFKPKMEDYTKRVRVSIVLALVLALVSSISLSAYLAHCVGQSEVAQPASSSNLAAQSARYETIGAIGSTGGASAVVSLQAQHQRRPQSLLQAESAANNKTAPDDSWMAAAAASGSTAGAHTSRLERAALAALLTFDVLWAIYSTFICFLVSFYFNLICSIMKSRFHGISKIIEDLAESNTTKTSNQARKITTLYLEHNEACELLDESNDFWQYLIFFTYFTYIPAYCYCLYNLFFVDFEVWPSFVTWVIHTHTGFIILLISFSAAGVSTEAHAPYTSLHTLSLIQLPLDVEVNVATFLHRVRGLTIGYSCYDLFAITNASMSNTAAACASYFLIVADFSRSSVFTLAQMNGSSATGATPTTPTPTG